MNNKGTKTQSGLWVDVPIAPEIEALAKLSVDAAFMIHCELGPGLLESAYEECFCHELKMRGIGFQKQIPVPLVYRGKKLELGFRADVLLENKLLIELKAVERLLPVHKAQVITYLKILRLPLGLLINFNEPLIKNGLHRILNFSQT